MKILTEAGLPPRVAEFTAGGHVAAGQGLLFDDARQLSRLIGRPTPRSVTVADALKHVFLLEENDRSKDGALLRRPCS